MFGIVENKYYIILYTLIIGLFTITFFTIENYLNPGFEIAVIVILLIIGIFSITYYTNNKKNMHTLAFVIIVLFGLFCVFLSPINDITDESEHFTRSEITSRAILIPEYVQLPNSTEHGYLTIQSTNDFYYNLGKTVFDTDIDDEKINTTDSYFSSAFAQNPFYAYIAQGLGIFIAKLLDLTSIWMLWLGRLFNLLLYGSIIYIAIRKTPVFKFEMMIVSILPLAIYQAGSMSADGLFSGLSILAIAYYLYFYKIGVNWKDLGIFYLIIVLVGLLKVPFLALSLLVLTIPANRFETGKQNVASKIGIAIVLAVGILWSSYSTSVLLNSWRSSYFANNNVNASVQLDYLANNPLFALERFLDIFNNFGVIIDRFFDFSNASGVYSSNLLSRLYLLAILLFSIICPLDVRFKLRDKIGFLLIAGLIYVATFFIQYLTWSGVGSTSIINGVHSRYFMPLLMFLPLMFGGMDFKLNKDKISLISLTLAIGFIAGMIILTISVKY